MLPTLAFGDVVVQTVATGLEIPWSLAFAPDGRLFISERPGRIRVIDVQGQLRAESVIDKSQLGTSLGEFYGIALDPNFSENHYLYLSHTFPEQTSDRIIRLIVNGSTATFGREILRLPNPSWGGRLKFGPDGFLYATTGTGGLGPGPGADDAQKLDNLRGKILRLTRDGAAAPGNPFPSSPIYAYGFRNSEGIAFDSSGQLYATDHGPVSNDKVHIVRAGHNYGWPRCSGTCEAPIRLFLPETVPPAGMIVYQGTVLPGWNNSLFFAVLGLPARPMGRHVHRILLDRPGGTNIKEEELLFKDQFGRIRDIVQGPNGLLYFSTSNREESGSDVRGPEDDRILRIAIADGGQTDGGVDGGLPADAGMDGGNPDGGGGPDGGVPDGGVSNDGGSDGPLVNPDRGGGTTPDELNNPIRVNTSGCSCAATGPGAMYLLALLGLLVLRQARRR
jgi:MYXO-CTERM domain-containing protein